MRILVTGKTGQVGYELERSLQGLGEIVALDRRKMDLSDFDQICRVIRDIRPNLIVNPAAYTAVDKAEGEPELAMRINGEAPGVMAEEAKKIGAAMIHYSTDYVFDGTQATPYLETDATCPINVYGRTKCAGEQAIQAAGIPHLILRTSWIYGMRGKNFLLTVLRLAKERNELRIVGDQFGAPTWCRTVADVSAHIVAQSCIATNPQDWWGKNTGVYHLTAKNKTSWAGFAEKILNTAELPNHPVVTHIAAQDYPLPAKRPENSELSCKKIHKIFNIMLPAWQTAVENCYDKKDY